MACDTVKLAVALLREGRHQRALALLESQATESRKWLGDDHYSTAELIGLQGIAMANAGELEKSLHTFRQAVPILLKAAFVQGEDTSTLSAQRLEFILETYMELLYQVRGTPLEQAATIDAAGESFRLADALRSQNTQAAVAASALRAAANDPRIGAEIRKEQDLGQEAASLHRILRDLMNTPADQQLPKVIADMKVRIATIKKEQNDLQADIARRFPAYANLVRPQPPTLAETRAALKPGEALINLFSTESGTFVWAFRQDGPVAFVQSRLSRAEVGELVQKLRKALDPGDADLANGVPDFDLDAGYRLYSELLTPVAAGWQGAASLLVSANGALSQVPLAVLPTTRVVVKPDPKLRYNQFKGVPWLIKQVAITQLPSINALVALRKLPPAGAQRLPFVGFGDPQFDLAATQVTSTRSLRNMKIARLSPQTSRNLEVSTSSPQKAEDKPLDWMDYRQIPPLPDTRDEILAIANSLHADPATDTFLGANASKANLKKLDLSKRKIVAFATHGLLPNDFPGVSEPSLALANPGDGNHGLLTLEEILGLKLDADWVVLSACNTAAGDGVGAEAVSGLGRGFFYAGTRALLVTHWPVETVSARLLVTGIFKLQESNPALSRAEALRQSMLAVMQQKAADASFAYAHPIFWAPYVLVGDGGDM